jgi:salicylate hydroxylase
MDSGATFRFGSRVVKVDSTRASITLENGEEIVADLIVGADGVDGITRSAISGESCDENGNRFLTISCTFPCDEFAGDPELKTLLNDETVCGFFFWFRCESPIYSLFLC